MTRPAHVMVYANAGSDANYFGAHGRRQVVLLASARIVGAIALLAFLLTSGFKEVAFGPGALLVTLVVVVALGVVTSAVLRARQRRYRVESGFQWAARYASYLGPFDDLTGVVGSLSFATANQPKVIKPPIVWLVTGVYRWTRRRLGSEPPGASSASGDVASPPRVRRRTLNVRLVLTNHAFLAVPYDELNKSLRLPLNRTTTIGITQSRGFGALSFEMLDGRKARFRVRADSTLIDQLASLGCTIEHRR